MLELKMSMRPEIAPRQEGRIHKIIQGGLFYPFFAGWQILIFTILTAGDILLSLRGKQLYKST